MIKKVLLAIALICPMLLSAQTLKIGLVNFGDILQAMPETTAAQTQLQEMNTKYEAEFKNMYEELNRLATDAQNAQSSETELPAVKERKAREFQDQQQRVAAFQQTAQQDLDKMYQDLMAPIQQKIAQAVESVGKEGNYSLIQMYDPSLTLYHADPVKDITPDVKAKLGLK